MEDNKYKPGDILAIDSGVGTDWADETFYFLIEGECILVDHDSGMEFMYPYRCLNDGKTGHGNFQSPTTRKVA